MGEVINKPISVDPNLLLDPQELKNVLKNPVFVYAAHIVNDAEPDGVDEAEQMFYDILRHCHRKNIAASLMACMTALSCIVANVYLAVKPDKYTTVEGESGVRFVKRIGKSKSV